MKHKREWNILTAPATWVFLCSCFTLVCLFVLSVFGFIFLIFNFFALLSFLFYLFFVILFLFISFFKSSLNFSITSLFTFNWHCFYTFVHLFDHSIHPILLTVFLHFGYHQGQYRAKLFDVFGVIYLFLYFIYHIYFCRWSIFI